MTELIREQMIAMGLMVCGGLSAGVVYEFFYRLRLRLAKIPGKTYPVRVLSAGLQILGLVLIGYGTSVFIYASSYGKITFQGIVCFFIGLILWHKLLFTENVEIRDGEEGEQTPGVRKE